MCEAAGFLDGDGAPPREGAAKSDLVGELEIAAHGQAGRQPRDRDPGTGQQSGEVGGGGFALQVRVGGEDDLGDDRRGQPTQQFGDVEVFGADVIDGADRPAEDVVEPAELAGAFDGGDVLGLLDDADGPII